MNPPKGKEREMPVADRTPNPMASASAESGPASDLQSAWRMPGGEDLLHFALSAGLAAGQWWLEQQAQDDACEAPGQADQVPAAKEAR